MVATTDGHTMRYLRRVSRIVARSGERPEYMGAPCRKGRLVDRQTAKASNNVGLYLALFSIFLISPRLLFPPNMVNIL